MSKVRRLINRVFQWGVFVRVNGEMVHVNHADDKVKDAIWKVRSAHKFEVVNNRWAVIDDSVSVDLSNLDIIVN